MSELGAATPAAPLDPAPPEEFLQAARLAPDHWLYLPDPAWKGEGPPPEWAVVGQWRSDSEGEIVEWEDNEDYRPSPEAMGWPEPADDVDRAIQLATTGYGPVEDVTAALARAEIAVLVTADGEPVSASAPDGTAVVPVYTSPRYLQAAGSLGYERLPAAELLSRIPPGHSLCLNSSGPVSMVLTTEGLAEVLQEAATAGAPAPRETPVTGAVPEDSLTPESEETEADADAGGARSASA
ncbi:type VII secretion system-associated protein [Streptomyces sp. NPDC014623]|uniref:type VII secretion system-associated protein n=1 Tax=Streptomyces sp. NPDC014623 TaxID=3364875 RepID=UPI003702060D